MNHLPGIERFEYWINAEIDMTTHLQKTENTAKQHAAFLTQKCYTAKQTVAVINQIVIPALEYKLCSLPWCLEVKDLVLKIERILAGVINRKNKVRFSDSMAYISTMDLKVLIS